MSVEEQASEREPLLIYGEYCSPYTRKMLALMRYRRIAYRLLQGGPGNAPTDLPKPKVPLLPTLYLGEGSASLEALVDSTPVLRRLEHMFPGRSVIPKDQGLSFVDYLLEDYGDEWLTKAMFHYRWAFDEDCAKAGALLPLQHTLGQPPKEQREAQQRFMERQRSRLYVVGSNETTAEVIEASYQRVLGALDSILERRPFLLGERPCASDFAVYGQLSQLVAFDPTPMRIALTIAPRVCAWVAMMDDLSGLGEHASAPDSRDEQVEGIQPLLREVGRTYVPVMLANARAVGAGETQLVASVDGKRWEQPVFPYQVRCLSALRGRYESLREGDRRWVDGLLEGTGCEGLFADGS